MNKSMYKILFVGFKGRVYSGFVIANNDNAAWDEALKGKILGQKVFADFRVPISKDFSENILKLEPVLVD